MFCCKMSMNEEAYHIDVVHALHDVMHLICEYLSEKDLSNMAKVCTSWRYAALHAVTKRIHFQQLRFPCEFDSMADILGVNCCATLLIYDSRLEKSLSLPLGGPISNGLEEEVLEDFKTELPHKTIVFKVEEYLTTEVVEFHDAKSQRKPELTRSRGILRHFFSNVKWRTRFRVPSNQTQRTIQRAKDQNELEAMTNCDILGYFFPNVQRKTGIRVACVQNFDDNFSDYQIVLNKIDKAADRLAVELGLHHCDFSKSAFLMFVNLSAISTRSVKNIKRGLFERIESDEKMTLTSIYGRELMASNSHSESNRSNRQQIVVLKISGPNTEFWTATIDFLLKRQEIERELHKLKEKVKPRRHCTGLIYLPKFMNRGCNHNEPKCDKSQGFMRDVKRIFPGIPFVGLSIGSCSAIKHKMPNKNTPFMRGFLNVLDGLINASIIIISYD